MRYGIAKARYVVLALLMFALSACGTAGTQTAGSGIQASGKLTANVVMPKNVGKTVALAGGSVTTTRLIVTGTTTPTARKDFAGNTGGTLEVYPGTGLIVSAQALDKDSVVLYEGFATDVVVGTNSTTTVTIDLNAPVVKAADANCLSCHESSRDITGQNLIADYKQSGHYKNVTWLANAKNGSTNTGCAGCHGTQHNDVQPAANGRCFECHSANLSLKHTSATALIAGEANPARYLNTTSNNCSACHEPHNPIDGIGKAERETWSESGHGDINAWPWAHYDFTVRDECNRCHTPAGFVKAQNNGFTDTKAASTTVSSGKQPLACNACHTDNKFSVRETVAFTGKYNGGATLKTYPDVGTSNLCVACHSGAESGEAIATSTADFSNKGFVNSHYMAAAGLMYMASPFINFTSLSAKVPTNNEGSALAFGANTYGRFNLPNSNKIISKSNGSVIQGIAFGTFSGTTSTHRKIGTTDVAGAETYLPLGGKAITTNGPCVSCHMQADNAIPGDTDQNKNIPVPAFRNGHGHSLAIDTDAAKQICLPCHADAPHLDGGDGKGHAKYTVTNSLATLNSAQVDPQRECYNNGLNLLKQILLAKYMIKYDPSLYPYFYDMQKDPAGKTAVTDWTRKNVAGVTNAAVAAFGSATLTPIPTGGLTQTQAKKLMGACFNLNLMFRDPAGFVHARTFVQRLVYDALDFLDNNMMDWTTFASARALNPTIYHGNGVNVLFVDDPANGKTLGTESMIWLSGTHYTDTKGTTFVPMKLHP